MSYYRCLHSNLFTHCVRLHELVRSFILVLLTAVKRKKHVLFLSEKTASELKLETEHINFAHNYGKVREGGGKGRGG